MKRSGWLAIVGKSAAALVATALALELGSAALLAFGSGLPSRDEIQSGLDAPIDPLPRAREDLAALGEEVAPRASGNVLHPYLGFVRRRNPGGTNRVNGRVVDDPVNDLGFFGPLPPRERSPDTLTVAIAGGSVATELYLYGRATLEERLEASPAGAGRDVEIASLALGGMKQPQQLMALSYALALGRTVDVLVNLDGFNEVVLPIELAGQGVHPAYPVRWRLVAAQRIDLEAAGLVGRIALLRERDDDWRRRFSRTALRESSLALLAWHALHARSQAAEAALERELGERLTPRDDVDVQVGGPPFEYATLADLERDAVDLWRRASLEMAGLCAARGILYVHALQPNQHVPDSKRVFTEREREVALAAEPGGAAVLGVREGYPLLRAAGRRLAQEGVAFLDLTDVFLDVEDRIYRDPCCHYTRRGYRIVAEHVADAIAARLSGF